MAKRGRPTDYKPEYNQQAYKYCLLGATDAEIALFFEVRESTLNLWKLKYPEFMESLKAGREIADQNVGNALYQRAMGYEHKDEEIFNYKGNIVRAKTIKHYPPDPTSMIFWLKNRQKEKWRDTVNNEHSGTVTVLNPQKIEKEE